MGKCSRILHLLIADKLLRERVSSEAGKSGGLENSKAPGAGWQEELVPFDFWDRNQTLSAFSSEAGERKIGNQESGVRSQESGVRSQESG